MHARACARVRLAGMERNFSCSLFIELVNPGFFKTLKNPGASALPELCRTGTISVTSRCLRKREQFERDATIHLSICAREAGSD